MTFFKKPYPLRRYGPQEIIGGHAYSSYTDLTVQLDVQPVSGRELEALPEGDRAVKHLKTFGDTALTPADEDTGVLGDRLRYKGRWYECVAYDDWHHSFLPHYEGQFVLLPPEGGDDDDHDRDQGETP